MFTNDYQRNLCNTLLNKDNKCKDCPLVISRDGKCVKNYSYDREKQIWIEDQQNIDESQNIEEALA